MTWFEHLKYRWKFSRCKTTFDVLKILCTDLLEYNPMEITKDTDIKFRPRGLSKDVGVLKQGESVACFYTTSKGWRKIRTQTGIIRLY